MPTELSAYCVKCREKREIFSPQAVYTSAGRAATQGYCPVCGTKLSRMGRMPAHEGLPVPEPVEREKRSRGRGTGRDLVIVESPTKAQVLGRFLGDKYRVRASMGHVRDLLRSRLSVDVDDKFRPTYRVPNEKKKVVKELEKVAQKAGQVYLATDPDREGEAIAWHLKEALGIERLPHHRVAFHEVTQSAVEEAFAHPRDIDMALVDAQQARRVLDRLVGYNLSPLLWKNVKGGLSAGRVQSVALRLVVEREREIAAFVPQEYWKILAELSRLGEGEGGLFRAELHRIDGKEFHLASQDEVECHLAELRKASYRVTEVRRRDRTRRPPPPFTTSSLQQDASSRLGFSPSRTMRLAQELYEGIVLGARGAAGLITYMRTDSLNVAPAAQRAAREYIRQEFGEGYLPASPPRYRGRARYTQEAHEAIRPTMVERTPTQVKAYLTGPQWRLYQLIWTRFVASQMVPAVFDTVSVDIEAGGDGHGRYLFRTTGSLLKFPGYLALFRRESAEDESEVLGVRLLYELAVDDRLRLIRLIPEQLFTQPPSRYTEASLVRELEEKGIGRPSTYAPTLSTLKTRGYVVVQERQLHPTELGCVVNDLLVEHFPAVVDVGFTAQMEEDLDGIARNEREWVEVVREFYGPFSQSLSQAQEIMGKVELTPEYTGESCELCGSPLVVKTGRYGKFIACSNYPTCRNTKPFSLKLGIACPECGGELAEKRSRRGRTFYGCNNYPRCRFASRRKPLGTRCPACGGLLVEAGRRNAQCLACGQRLAVSELEAQLAHPA